jgi:hypothetical protein
MKTVEFICAPLTRAALHAIVGGQSASVSSARDSSQRATCCGTPARGVRTALGSRLHA